MKFDVCRYVTRNRGSLDSIVMRATDVQRRKDDLTAILDSEGLTRADICLLGHDGIAYELGSPARGDLLDKVARQVALRDALAAKGIATVPDGFDLACRSYVRTGGDIVSLIDWIKHQICCETNWTRERANNIFHRILRYCDRWNVATCGHHLDCSRSCKRKVQKTKLYTSDMCRFQRPNGVAHTCLNQRNLTFRGCLSHERHSYRSSSFC